jgi:hypothetical protein
MQKQSIHKRGFVTTANTDVRKMTIRAFEFNNILRFS